ncbi:uncharacterized protein K460DRAFT_284013 [Cucurbitaria berberidis CBS 394.84]|uniref:DUF7924 domain-containing protein n=1 Tax=Cucurbitaria berberidis CBS 394.84 TaxID=1168544 RepID=A0A9P4L9E4_9PLEO|nr:uncharacterized protein K460DRAFT_284013 [Cucurbitaria berberidis CBS 394.84]KAF1846292.1 hypothetical protein K460DRAFT_284013 [Cucurbitaria berberidis CBS 394.84]
MKRKQSDSLQTDPGSACSVKRLKNQYSKLDQPRTSPTPPLTEEALCSQLNHKAHQSSVRHWVETSTADCDPEMMAAPPTPRSAPSNNRGRRPRRARTPSPSKQTSPQTYRTRNLHQAGVFVDRLGYLPSVIDNEVRGILDIKSWDDQVAAATHDARIETCAARYQTDSRRNARNCSLEGDWKASLYNLLVYLSDLWPDELQAHMSEKVWNAALKPTSTPYNETEDQRETRDFHTAQTALPSFNTLDDSAINSTFAGPVPSLPPSLAPTSSSEAADPYHISTPKPDITVGLAHTAFSQQNQRQLVDHQASGSILSDPHAADMGIRFPFLVVEAKGQSVNGSLVSAENQAAVSGASMLAILQDLDCQVAWDSGSSSDRTHQSNSDVCFSIVTAGPIHTLWVHFNHQGAVYMECIRSWRTTHNVRELVHFLSKILEWGRGKYKDGIVEKLDKAPRV